MVIYWIENCLLLSVIAVYLGLLIPFNYVRIGFQIIRLSLSMGSSSEGPP